jgi:hypothetical protein
MIKDKDYKLHYDNFDKIKVNGVYLIRNLDNNSLKIGMTDNLKRRLKEIGKSFQFCGVIPKLEVEVFIEYKYNYELEQYLHKEFSNNRIQNEWFDIEDILIVLQKLGEFQYNLKCIDNIITKKEMKTNNYIINPNVITKNDGEINLIKLDNEFFNLDNYTFKKIGTEGFVIYTYLLMRQSNSCSCEVTIKGMLSFFNRDLKNAPTVSYRKDRIS